MMKMVVVELVGGHCNSRCLWCFTTYKCRDKMVRGMMDLDNFRRFISLNRDSVFRLIPFSHGEALIHPDFVTCCAYALDNGFPLQHIHTNLAMDLTTEHFDILARFTEVVVNVGGGCPETHYVNTGTNFDTVLANLQDLSKRNPEILKVKMVVNRNNLSELGILKRRIHGIHPSISVSSYPVYFGPADSDDEDRKRFFLENLATEDGNRVNRKIKCRDKVKITKDGRILVSPRLGRCYGLIPTIRWDGSVNICCRARYHERSEGDAFSESLDSIMRSEQYREALKQGRKRTYVDYCHYCS